MKTLFHLILFFSFLFPAVQARSQNVAGRSACGDTYILHQVDSIKQEFSKQGFIIVKEASMTMESANEIPVIIPLIQDTWDQFVFIGDVSSRSYEVRLFDWDEKQVAYQKKQSEDLDANVLSYSYTPKFTEYHMMKPLQVSNDKKNLCGYVMLLKKVK